MVFHIQGERFGTQVGSNQVNHSGDFHHRWTLSVSYCCKSLNHQNQVVDRRSQGGLKIDAYRDRLVDSRLSPACLDLP